MHIEVIKEIADVCEGSTKTNVCSFEKLNLLHFITVWTIIQVEYEFKWVIIKYEIECFKLKSSVFDSHTTVITYYLNLTMYAFCLFLITDNPTKWWSKWYGWEL